MYKVILLFMVLVFSSTLWAAPKRLALITPRSAHDAFWGPFQTFSEAAAKHFGYQLDTFFAENDHLQMTQLVEAAMIKKYDGIILSNFKRQGKRAVQLAQRYKVPVIFVTGGFEEDEGMGEPRIRYPFWIGQLLPDDEQAGELLLTELLQLYRSKFPNKQPTIFGLEGNIADSGSYLRKRGVMAELKKQHLGYTQFVPANWCPQMAEEKFLSFKKGRYPQIDLVWSASDLMGIGVAKAAKKLKFRPGVDLLIGGVDWSPEGIEAIKNGDLQVSVGGHLFQGGWAIVLFYDYFNQFDFAAEKTTFKTEMKALTKSNLAQGIKLLDHMNWSKIDFSSYSKAKNPTILRYSFKL